MPAPTVRFGYADTALGQLHYAEAGSGTPVILLHQTPRSWDEFRDVIPLIAASGRRAIAMDMYGFGASAKPEPGIEQTIEMYAEGVIALADALGLESFAVVGHHTGAFVASEISAAVPDRVLACVFSAGEYGDQAARDEAWALISRDDFVDRAPNREDGSHLMTLWAKRYPLYPKGRPDILNRFIRDALAVDPVEGHIACARYVMEDRAHLVTAPLLVIANTGDPVAYPHKDKVAAGYTNAASVDLIEIEGGFVCADEHMYEEFSAHVVTYLDKIGV
ncbi:alpha/beta fold hydrolase [Arthrobacter sp. CAU 1506]|uniref:alpha/beta fold hydrolase n=1 Tax=Arthrobacter sp. CAU 1506 TaxID=2560052 RepID=UPI0010AD21C7|nr:alpha/beta fold hydrolase [Arthrobacter sp. CAU 1506]TJY66261.1 alpha/beta fold hydrolase [Arthrobacter sp. CAU 1506]